MSTDALLFDLVGYAAAALTTLSFVPQAIKTLKSNDTRSLSLGMYALFSLGVALWLVYGLYVEAGPVIVANAVTLCLTSLILAMKMRNTLALKE